MTDEEQKRRGISDVDRKSIEERESAMKNKSKQEGSFSWKKYESPTSTPTATPTPTPTYNDPLKRNMSYAERLKKGFSGR